MKEPHGVRLSRPLRPLMMRGTLVIAVAKRSRKAQPGSELSSENILLWWPTLLR